MKAIRYESTNLNRLVADKSHCVTLAILFHVSSSFVQIIRENMVLTSYLGKSYFVES